LAHTKPQTFFGEFLHEAVLTDAQLQKEKNEAADKESEAFFGEDEDE